MSRLRQRRGNREGLNAGSQCSSPSPSLLAPRPLSRARLDFLFTNASIGPLGGLNNYIDHRIVAVAAQPLGARPAASQSVSKLERLTSRLAPKKICAAMASDPTGNPLGGHGFE